MAHCRYVGLRADYLVKVVEGRDVDVLAENVLPENSRKPCSGLVLNKTGSGNGEDIIQLLEGSGKRRYRLADSLRTHFDALRTFASSPV